MPDNFRFDISSDKQKHFDYAIEIAFSSAPGGKAYIYRETDSHGLILSWTGQSINYTKLPFPLDVESAKPFVWSWLKNQPIPESPWMGGDGDIKKGFRVYNEAWGHVNGDHYAFVAIMPTAMYYGK